MAIKYVIFHRQQILDRATTDNIIASARRGKITPAGAKIMLVPDTRFGERDVAGYREFANGQTVGRGSRQKRLPRLRKSELIPLVSMVPKHLRP